MIIKLGSAKLIQVSQRPEEIIQTVPLQRLRQRLANFDSVRLDPARFLYVRNRAISSEEMWGSNCLFQKNALVFTDDGPKKIVDIKIGDRVLTHRGIFQTVTRLYTKKAFKKIIIKIKHSGYTGDLEEYEIDGTYDIIIACGVLQFLHEQGEEFVKQIMKKTKTDGINVIDAFRNKWLPKGKLEKIYFGWKVSIQN